MDLKFDKIFGEIVDYDDLNIRLRLTQSKKKERLMVLDHPEVPLHNNLSENGIRPVVIKRKISGGTRTEDGTIARENYLSILEPVKNRE